MAGSDNTAAPASADNGPQKDAQNNGRFKGDIRCKEVGDDEPEPDSQS